ncbi:MAG: hypothetical protein WAW06_12810 [bacterium]
MPKILSRFLKSAEAKKRAHRIAGFMLLLVAMVDWWIVIEDGVSPARVITGIAASGAAVLELVFPRRRGLLRRRGSAPAPCSHCEAQEILPKGGEMTFKALLTIKAVICVVFGPILLFVPAALLKFLGSSLESGGAFTAREYGAALIGGFFLTLLARNTSAPDARRAILLYLLVYDAIGAAVTLGAVGTGVLNSFGLGIAVVYLFFTVSSAWLLLRRRVTQEAGA